MSLLNVRIESNRAFVSVDTQSKSLSDGNFSHSNKLLVMPQANVVWAARGERTLLYFLFSQFLQCSDALSLDLIETMLPQVIEDIFQNYLVQVRALGQVDLTEFETVEIAIVGFSERTRSWTDIHVTRRPGDTAFAIGRRDTGAYAPAFSESLAHITVPDMRALLVEVARAQIRRYRQAFPDAPIGGDLIVAEISDRRVVLDTIRDVG